MNSEKRLNNKGVGAGAGADAGVACGKIRSIWPPATSVLWHLLASFLVNDVLQADLVISNNTYYRFTYSYLKSESCHR